MNKVKAMTATAMLGILVGGVVSYISIKQIQSKKFEERDEILKERRKERRRRRQEIDDLRREDKYEEVIACIIEMDNILERWEDEDKKKGWK